MQTKIIQIESIGLINLVKSSRARNINITVRPFEDVKVTVPARLSFKKAEEFVLEKLDWVQKSLQKTQKMEDKFTVFDEEAEFRTRSHVLEITGTDEDLLIVRVLNNKIKVTYPKNMDVRMHDIQLEIRKGIERAFRKEAKEYLPVRIRELSEEFGFEYENIFIKNAKTRWGSCSSVNNINLSIHLMRLPDYLIDYVILHELVHTVEKNHGKEFWFFLDRITGDAKGLDKELKKYRIEIF